MGDTYFWRACAAGAVAYNSALSVTYLALWYVYNSIDDEHSMKFIFIT